MNNLFFALGEKGDVCLIPAPYYAAFENDMNVLAGVNPVAVDQANPVAGPTEAELDLTFEKVIKVRNLCCVLELFKDVISLTRCSVEIVYSPIFLLIKSKGNDLDLFC